MRFRELLRRELSLVFGARITWLVAALSALLTGHGLLLAVDLYTAASRSALGSALMQREMDPLAGLVRPALGGLQLATSLLVPLVAARSLAIEKERRSFGALALAAGGTTPVLLAKGLSSLLGAGLSLAGAWLGLGLLALLGAPLDGPETLIALAGRGLHLALVVALSLCAAAASPGVAQAAAAALALSLGSWAIEAGEGFAPLGWLGSLDWLSIDRRLAPFDLGLLHLGALGWLLLATSAALGGALALGRVETPAKRFLPALALAALGLSALAAAARVERCWDWSEQRRASLPPSVVAGLRALPGPLRLTLWLDRDDGRRALVERDAVARLRRARPDLQVVAPLDAAAGVGAARGEGYGRVVVQAAGGQRETRSTSRRELVTLVFEAAGAPLPPWDQPAYEGHPALIEGSRRRALAAAVYALIPGALAAGSLIGRRTRRRT